MMNKSAQLFFVVVIAGGLMGCSSKKQNENDIVMKAASQCTNEISTASKGKNGTTKHANFLQDDMTYIRVGDTALATHHVRGIPYFESSALDGGVPGSAWKNCMLKNGFKIG